MKEVMQLVWTGLWSWLGGGWGGFKGKKLKKISHDHAKWTRRHFLLQIKGKSQSWFRMTMRKFRTVMQNAPKRWKLVLMHFWLRTNMGNCWSLCEMTMLLLNSRFLGKEASRRPLRWGQVSNWPWPINRNLIFSWKEFFWTFLIVEFFKFPFFIEFSTFLHFLSFSR